MKKIALITFAVAFLCLAPAFAELDIVQSGSDSNSAWVVEDTGSGKTIGSFWDPDNQTSDFGYETESGTPEFFWSNDRKFVAVNGGARRSAAVFVYQVTPRTLKPVEIPALSEDQAADIDALKNVVADGTEAVRWQGDGTLLVHFWAVDCVTREGEEQKRADVWADVEVSAGGAKIVGTSIAEPSDPSAQNSLPPNPAPPAGETLASQEPPVLGQACSGEQPPEESEPVFVFDKKEYFLRGDEAGIREYLTGGESFEKWTTLISTRRFTETSDPRAYAFALVKNAKASGPNAQGQVMENDEAGSYIADFIVYSEEGEKPSYAEWNLWRIEKTSDGIEAVQYARRFYDVNPSTAKTLISARERIVPQLATLDIPK